MKNVSFMMYRNMIDTANVTWTSSFNPQNGDLPEEEYPQNGGLPEEAGSEEYPQNGDLREDAGSEEYPQIGDLSEEAGSKYPQNGYLPVEAGSEYPQNGDLPVEAGSDEYMQRKYDEEISSIVELNLHSPTQVEYNLFF